jgi:hypothetical protein
MSSESVAIVQLYLVVEEDSAFYLEIPLDRIRALCLSHRMYRLYLGWCILDVVGSLSLRDKKGWYRTIPPIVDLVEGERYYLTVSNQGTVFFDHTWGTRHSIFIEHDSPLLTSRSSRREGT